MLTSFAAAVALLAAPILAQVTTDCDPREKTCPNDPAFGTEFFFDFKEEPSRRLWEQTVRGVEFDEENGAAFTVDKQGDSPTLRSKFYFFFGRTEMTLKVAPGQGIISSMMWLSDDLDEVDYEFFGEKGDYAASNIFGKGYEIFKFGEEHEVGSSVVDEFHTYTVDWTAERIEWYVDGELRRTLRKEEAVDEEVGDIYPQTPMRMSLGIWAGGDPSLPEGTREWAGGDTDYSKGPYTMYVKDVRIIDYSEGKEYKYGDRSGSMESIEILPGKSDALAAIEDGFITRADDLRLDPEGEEEEDAEDTADPETNIPNHHAPPTDEEAEQNGDSSGQTVNEDPGESMAEKWEKLPQEAKLGIYGGSGAVAAVLIGVAAWYCIKQRRHGKRQAQLAEEKYNAERAEEDRLRRDGINPDSFAVETTEYHGSSKEMHDDPYSTPTTAHSSITNPPPPPLAGGPLNRQNSYEPVRSPSGANGLRSPAPLLQNEDPHSPMSGSPGPGMYGGAMAASRNDMYDSRPGSSHRSPTSPVGAAGRFPSPANPRSASSPNPHMRMASPGPQHQGYVDYRTQSPAQMHPPARSFSSPRPPPQYQPPYAPQGQGYGHQGGHGNYQEDYWNSRI